MARLLASLLALIGAGPAKEGQDPKVQMIDPATILYSISTINDDLPELDEVAQVTDNDLVFHEDEWRQIEFYSLARLGEIEGILRELAVFETAHRRDFGFTKIYVRKIPSKLVLPNESTPDALSSALESARGRAPILFTGANSVTGRVRNGFSLPLGPKVYLYGTESPSGVDVLAANVDAGGDHQLLTSAFATLNKRFGLIAVDWRSHMILVGVGTKGDIEVWKPS